MPPSLSSLVPQKFTDFAPDYIQNLASQKGFTYVQQSTGDPSESSLYNNPVTNTLDLYKLQFAIAGMNCEFYTSDFVPVMYAQTLKAALGPNATPEVEANSRWQVQVFSIALPYTVENLYVESRTNVTLNNILGLKSVAFKNSELVQLEGDFSYFFRAYVPHNEEVNAFTILAPNIMLELLKDGGDYDFEFSGNKIYFYKTFGVMTQRSIHLKQVDYDHMLAFGEQAAQSLVRASRPAKTTDTTNMPQMWQLYGTSSTKLFVTIGLFMAAFWFLATCLIFPPLWPVGIVILIIFFVRYRKLLAKRRRLIVEWHSASS